MNAPRDKDLERAERERDSERWESERESYDYTSDAKRRFDELCDREEREE